MKQRNDRIKQLKASMLDNVHAMFSNDMLFEIDKLTNALISTQHTYFTGIGKSSFLAMKWAATMKSLCFRSQYLHAIDALHGDMGELLSFGDRTVNIVMLSKSGMSSELAPLIEQLLQVKSVAEITLLTMQTDLDNAMLKDYEIKGVNVIRLHDIDPVEFDTQGIVPTESNALFELAFSIALAGIPIRNEELLTRLRLAHPGGSLQNKVTNILNSIVDNEN